MRVIVMNEKKKCCGGKCKTKRGAGKGDEYRSVDLNKWDEGWEKAFGTKNKENLADISFINKEFMDKGYKVIENFNFEEQYNKKYNMSNAEKEFSFLNQVVVLQKK